VDLAERLEMSQSGITRMLAPMEKVGWVERGEDPRDGRVGYVVLRKSGRRLAREGARTLGTQASALFGEPWTDEELATLTRLLGRITANLRGQLTAA
jgi:DNA-binding MarR family transcriptional regulator